MAKPPGVFDEDGKWNDKGSWNDADTWKDGPSDLTDDALLSEAGLPLLTENGEPIEAETLPLPQFIEIPSITPESGHAEVIEDPSTPPAGEMESGGVEASAWTGRFNSRQRAMVVKACATAALPAIERLVADIERRRFNDPETAKALDTLRELHRQLGELLSTLGTENSSSALGLVEKGRRALMGFLSTSQLGVAAPIFTFGIVHLLSALTGVGIDSTMVAGVYAVVMTSDELKALKEAG